MIRSSRRVVTSLRPLPSFLCAFFFFNDTATTEIYTLSLHDALPISGAEVGGRLLETTARRPSGRVGALRRSEEHTSELQSPCNLVCRLLLEKKKKLTTASLSRDGETSVIGPRPRSSVSLASPPLQEV